MVMGGASFAGLTVTTWGDSSVSFGSVSPGDYKKISTNSSNAYTYCNELRVTSTDPIQWTVKIDAEPLTNAGLQIASGFRWFATAGLYDGASWNDLTPGIERPGFNDFPSYSTPVYTSGKCTLKDDRNDNLGGPTEIQFQYDLQMPYNTIPGNYSTRITYTVTQ